MVAVKEGEGYDPLESYSAEMDAPRRYMAIGEPGGWLHCLMLLAESSEVCCVVLVLKTRDTRELFSLVQFLRMRFLNFWCVG